MTGILTPTLFVPTFAWAVFPLLIWHILRDFLAELRPLRQSAAECCDESLVALADHDTRCLGGELGQGRRRREPEPDAHGHSLDRDSDIPIPAGETAVDLVEVFDDDGFSPRRIVCEHHHDVGVEIDGEPSEARTGRLPSASTYRARGQAQMAEGAFAYVRTPSNQSSTS